MTAFTQRLALGTVQFGLAYGVSNSAGRPEEAEVAAILALARSKGTDTLDTAPAYGESEAVLGRVGTAGFRVISKVPKLPQDLPDVRAYILDGVRASLSRLGLPRLQGLLLHDPEDLTSARGPLIRDAVLEAQALGLVEKVGLSIYDPARLEAFVKVLPPQIVQAPFNILDQRLVVSGWADRLKALGAEVHVRSAFLQGLLLFSAQTRPAKFAAMPAVWRVWEDWLASTGLTPLEACLRFVAGHRQVDRIVVGVNSAAEFAEIAGVTDAPLTSLPDWPNDFDQRLIDPSTWSSL